MADKAAFLFIVGCGRSGTTLLRSMLDSHPSLAIVREGEFAAALAVRREQYDVPGGFDSDAFVRDIAGRPKSLDRLRITEPELADLIRAEAPDNCADAIRAVYGWYAKREGKQFGGDKTPTYVLQVAALAETFPEARFVHIIRDGRDVALSWSGTRFGPRSLPEAAYEWRKRVLAGCRAGERLGPERYHELRYEALVADARKELDAVCAFLGLPFDEAMLAYHERPVEELGASEAHQTRLLLPPTTRLRDWRREMPRPDVATFEVIAGGTLSRLGYERSTGTSPGRWPAAGATWVKWRTKGVRARLRKRWWRPG